MPGDKLRACPFCNGVAKVNYVSGNENYNQSWHVCCQSCGLSLPPRYGSSTWKVDKALDITAKDAAIAAWNRRAPAVTPTREEVARVLYAAADDGRSNDTLFTRDAIEAVMALLNGESGDGR